MWLVTFDLTAFAAAVAVRNITFALELMNDALVASQRRRASR